MASKDQPSVVRRSSRGRTAIDAKTKTDSGCFVDDDVEKQTQIDKSPPGKKGESKFVKFKREDSNEIISHVNTKNKQNNPLVNGKLQNAAVEGRGEMSQSDERLNNEESTHDDFLSSINNSIDDTKPNEDFYCLYYSDSPNGSLTRNKDKKETSKPDYDLAARAEELLEKVKSEALYSTPRSPDTTSNDVGPPSPKRKGPPVAPKPKRNLKQNSKPSRDPILDELDQLGASIGRDFSNVNENDPSLFSNAVQELQVAQTPEECFDRFDAIQTALLENVPDTLERKKAKSAREDSRRKSFPGTDKSLNLSDKRNQNGNLKSPESKTRPSKKAESPKTKFEVKKFSRTEKQSLHSMKGDSSHKRSHLNSDTAVKPPPTRPDVSKSTKSEATKRLAGKIESNKTNLKKDKRPTPPLKGAKVSKKVTTSPKDDSTKSNSNTTAKRKERLEFRSSRRRLNGDLSSIPEDAVIGTKNDSLSDNKVIPLAKGEDDLSEDDLDMYEDETFEGTVDLSYEEMDFPPPPSICTTSTSNSTVSKEATISITQTTSNIFERNHTVVSSSLSTEKANRMSASSNTSVNSQKFENPNDHRSKLSSTNTSVVSQTFQNFKDHNFKPSFQLHSSRNLKSSSLSSDGWTSESTAGYSSANDADDETDRQPELETSEDFETYEDPVEIVDMTFGDGLVESEGDGYIYVEQTPRQPHIDDIELDRSISPSSTNHFQPLQQRDEYIYAQDTPRQPQINDEVADRRDSHSSTSHFQPPQQVRELNNYPLESEAYPMDVDTQEVYEPGYYENEVQDTYYPNYNAQNLIEQNVAANDQNVLQTRHHNNQSLEEYEMEALYTHEDVPPRPTKKVQEQGPDPSGFMTVQDIRRLIFKGQKPGIERSSSFCGSPNSIRRRSQGEDSFQRQSWSGYSARQQQEPGVDPLVREFPQNATPVEEAKTSPYVRTVVQKSRRQPDHYSDSNLAAAVGREKRLVGRSQSFCGRSLQRRTNSLDDYHLQVVNEEGERARRARSFCDAPLQRRTNSLDGYYSSNRVSPGIQRSVPTARQLTRKVGLVRSTSDSSSDYSQSDNEQHYEQFRRVNDSPRSLSKPSPQYIDAHELAKLMSPHASAHEIRHNDQRSLQEPQPLYNSLQHGHRAATSTYPRKSSSECLRIQAIRRSSQINSDSESDVYVDERYKNPPNLQPPKQLTVVATNSGKPKPKTLSERFSDVPQRVSLEELAEQLNLPDDEDDDSTDEFIVERPESEYGADLEFDFGDYFDEKNMIVGEALRLKKVLGCDTEQDPELETIVTATTDPNLPVLLVNEVNSIQISQPTQTDDYMTLEQPPPYHEVRKEMKANSRVDSPSYYTVYDRDGSYPSESEYSDYGKPVEKLAVPMYGRNNTSNRQRRDTETQTEEPTTEKAISAEELMKLLMSSSQGNVSQNKPPAEVQQKQQQTTVQNLLFPAPQTKAASTGNIHSEQTFPGHVCQLYGNGDVNSDNSNLNRRRNHTPPPKYHKSHESLRRGRPSSAAAVLKAKLVSSSENVKPCPNGSSGRVFEEEVDCMKTKGVGDFSSSEFSSGSSVDDVGEKKSSPMASVSYIGCEETTKIETLPRVKLSSQRRRRKEKVGFLSDQDIPTGLQNTNQVKLTSKRSSEKLTNGSASSNQNEAAKLKQEDKEKAEKVVLRKKEVPKLDLSQVITDDSKRNPDHVENSHQITHFPRDELPSPNSVNVFIDYKKNVMKVTTSTPKIHHGKLITESPTGLSPIAGSPDRENEISRSPQKSPKETNVGQEEFPPRYDSSSSGSSERSSSVYSSDDEKFFGSNDTVVFVEKSTEKGSDKPTVDVTSREDQDNEVADIDAYSARVDSLLREVRSSLDLDSIGSDLLDQAMERVKDRLSPRSQASGGITMEALVALNQADELQSLINEIKGELRILQEENTMLKERVVSLQHGDSCSTSETTEESLTESAERIESIRKQIAAVVVDKSKADNSEEEDYILIDVFLRGFGEPVGLKSAKKTDVKLGQVNVKGGTDWTGVYDAAKSTFLDHIKHIDTSSSLGLGPTSMYGAQIGATMLTPETLRKKNPRVEISRRFNSCVIQLKDGMTDNFDTLIYDTLIPKPVVESYVHQILENRFVMLCGPSGIGKSHFALKLAEHLAQRFGYKAPSAVLTLSVQEKSRKELKKILATLMKCDISTPSDGVPVVVVLDQLDCLASLADIFQPKQLEGNRNSPFIIGVRNKSKKGPFSAKDLAIHKYFRWFQMSVYDRYVLGLLERFLRRKLSWTDNVGNEEDLLDLFIWLTQVWQHINQILISYVDVQVTMGPSVFYTCPMDVHAAEGWFANVWNYTIIPYLHQNIRNSTKIYERDVPWQDPTKWVIMRWPWSRERSKVLTTLKKLRQVDIVLNRNHMESDKDKKKGARSKLRKLRSNLVKSPSKAGSLESWSTADWETASATSDDESIATSTL